jgi:phage replication O-like protein O
MAKPQTEEGHTKIANEILDHFITLHLAPNQWQIMMCIIRKTYGYHKKIDYIANAQIIDTTGLCKSVVSRAISEMVERNILTKNGKYLGLQKDWELWKEFPIQTTFVDNTANYLDNNKLAKQPTNDDNNTTNVRNTELANIATNVSNSDTIAQDKKLAILQPKLAILQPELAETATKVSSPRDTQKKDTITKDTIQKKLLEKKSYGEFQNVFLTDSEFKKLNERFNGKTNLLIENLSQGIESHGYKYKSHYATILNWASRDDKKNKGGIKSGNITKGNPWENDPY